MKICLITPAMLSRTIKLDDIKAKKLIIEKKFSICLDCQNDKIILKDKNICFNCYSDGLLVFNFFFDFPNNLDYSFYLKEKERISKLILDINGEFVAFLKFIDSLFTHSNLEKNYFYNGKYVSYCLATYFINDLNYNLSYSLALKREICDYSKCCEQSLNIVNLDNQTKLLLVWGARIFVTKDNNRIDDYNKYIESETTAQYLWFLITSINKKIDQYMTSEKERSANIELLLSQSYEVIYSKSKFDTVLNSRVHRYEMDIMTSIIKASKIDLLSDNLEKKIDILKQKSIIVANKIEKKNNLIINALLFFISFLSSVSTIYSCISIFSNPEHSKKIYLIVVIASAVIFISAYVFKYLMDKKNK